MASSVSEIARQEGTGFRSVRLALAEDGGIKMDAQDIGPASTKNSALGHERRRGHRPAQAGTISRSFFGMRS